MVLKSVKKIIVIGICLTSLSANLFGQSETNYRIKAVKKNAPGIESLSNTVLIQKSTDLFVPSAFTPNGDGVNDQFQVVGQGIDEIEILIYNRWGELIFTSSSVDQQWDGTYKGKESPSGVYVYRIRAKNESRHTWTEKEGQITLLR